MHWTEHFREYCAAHPTPKPPEHSALWLVWLRISHALNMARLRVKLAVQRFRQ